MILHRLDIPVSLIIRPNCQTNCRYYPGEFSRYTIDSEIEENELRE